MKERPILFTGEMVMAILERRKTQSRRAIKLQDFNANTQIPWGGEWEYRDARGNWWDVSTERLIEKFCPYGKPGDRLWVKENAYIAPLSFCDFVDCNRRDAEGRPRLVGYAAGMSWDSVRVAEDYGVRLSPSIFMPRWASRIELEITNVRVERVQDISKADAKSEGMYCGFQPPYDFSIGPYDAYTANFRRLWNKINAKRGFGWDANPWVWVIAFKVVEK